MRHITLLVVAVLALLAAAPAPAAADGPLEGFTSVRPDSGPWRAVLRHRVDGEAATFGLVSTAFAVPATIAGLATRQRTTWAPQAAFVSSGLTALHLIPFATLGLVKAGLHTARTPRSLRRSLRGAAWTLGVASGITAGTFAVFMVSTASWQDSAWSFAIMQVPLGMFVSTVLLSVWADRLARVHRGENPLVGQRGRPRPIVTAGPGALLVRW